MTNAKMIQAIGQQPTKQWIWRTGLLSWCGILLLLDLVPTEAGFLYHVDAWQEWFSIIVGFLGFLLIRNQKWAKWPVQLLFAVALAGTFDNFYVYGNCVQLRAQGISGRSSVVTSVGKKEVIPINRNQVYFSMLSRPPWRWQYYFSLRFLGWNEVYLLTVPLPPWTPAAEAVLDSSGEFRHPRWQSIFQQLKPGERVRVTLVNGRLGCPCIQDIEKISQRP